MKTLNEKFNGNVPEEAATRLMEEMGYLEELTWMGDVLILAGKISDMSADMGYPIADADSLDSSFIAYLMGTTDINPLPESLGGFDIPCRWNSEGANGHYRDITILDVAEPVYSSIRQEQDDWPEVMLWSVPGTFSDMKMNRIFRNLKKISKLAVICSCTSEWLKLYSEQAGICLQDVPKAPLIHMCSINSQNARAGWLNPADMEILRELNPRTMKDFARALGLINYGCHKKELIERIREGTFSLQDADMAIGDLRRAINIHRMTWLAWYKCIVNESHINV